MSLSELLIEFPPPENLSLTLLEKLKTISPSFWNPNYRIDSSTAWQRYVLILDDERKIILEHKTTLVEKLVGTSQQRPSRLCGFSDGVSQRPLQLQEYWLQLREKGKVVACYKEKEVADLFQEVDRNVRAYHKK
ncbi:hypothetical protein HYX13_01015 [Candidatus Woesearchaeota archaeon]|nr:hypothetical protein [Candidatus Woesearchaeota archaeon]